MSHSAAEGSFAVGPAPAGPRLDPGLVLFVGFAGERPGEPSWPALAALAAADVVLYDNGIDPRILALIPPASLAEPVAAGPAAGEPAAVARARKLAGEGWRVVRLVAGDPAESREAEPLARCGIRIGTLVSPSRDATLPPEPTPQAFSTALNGLAG